MPTLHRATAIAAALALTTSLAVAASHTTGQDGEPASDSTMKTDEGVTFTGFRDLSYGERTGGAQLTANLINLDGEEIGRATFSITPSGIVVIRAEASGLDDGEHGFHIHETGKCEPETEFKSAGGHYVGEDDPEHGLVEGGPHAGDLPNVVATNGSFAVEHFNPRITLDGDKNPLMDDDGSAIMVHSEPDDYESQPSGDAGGRIACGVIVAGE